MADVFKFEKVCAMFQHFGKKWVFQREKSPEGFIHYQCLLQLKLKLRATQLVKSLAVFLECEPANIQLSPSDAGFVPYCTKIDTRTDGPWSCGIIGVPVKPPKLLAEADMFPWQKDLISKAKEAPNDRTILWYSDPVGGAGKTQLCKWFVHHMGAFIFGGKAADMASRIVQMTDAPTIAICNIPRTHADFVSYQTIEAIKDGLVVTGKYEGGQKIFDSPHVIIFANFEPCYESLSKDRWKVIKLSTLLAPMFSLPE